MTSKVTFEATPNPATLKFNLYRTVTEAPLDCPTAVEAERSPLASKIFGFPWTAGVGIGRDFVTVTKHDWVDWSVLAQPLAGLIQEHMDRGEDIISTARVAEPSSADENDSEIVCAIKLALDRDVRPVVALDGGDVVFAKYEDQVLSLHMRGACAGCPSSSATLKQGIEVRMKELFPDIREVVGI